MDKMIGGDNFCDIDTVDDFFDFQKKPPIEMNHLDTNRENSQVQGKGSFKDKLENFKSDFN